MFAKDFGIIIYISKNLIRDKDYEVVPSIDTDIPVIETINSACLKILRPTPYHIIFIHVQANYPEPIEKYDPVQEKLVNNVITKPRDYGTLMNTHLYCKHAGLSKPMIVIGDFNVDPTENVTKFAGIWK